MNIRGIILTPEKEQEIVILAYDISNSTNAKDLRNISKEGKEILKFYLDSLFSYISTNGEDLSQENISDLFDTRYLRALLKWLINEDYKIFRSFIEELVQIPKKIEGVEPNSVIFVQALASLFINLGLLSKDIENTSTSLCLEFASMVQDKITDILSDMSNEEAIRTWDITQAWVYNFRFALVHNTKWARAVYGARRSEIESKIDSIQGEISRFKDISLHEQEFMKSNEDDTNSVDPEDIQLHWDLCEIRDSIELQIFALLQWRNL